jgi:hypothetical protein
MNSIDLPVSFGEALDKLSILAIKLDKIKDDRRKDVQVEYDMLFDKLRHLFAPDVRYQYAILKDINLLIWEQQDILRCESDTGVNKLDLALIVLEENDRRFRVKAKINNLMNSLLREQKGYARRKVLIRFAATNKVIRYLSTLYEQIHVLIGHDNSNISAFSDDPTIVFVTTAANESEYFKVLHEYTTDVSDIYTHEASS